MVIGYIYNNVVYKINADGETVTAIENNSNIQLPETVTINNKNYTVIQENILITCSVSPDTEYIKGKAILHIEVATENTELKEVKINDNIISLTNNNADIEITNNGKYTVKAVSLSDNEYISEITISNIIKLSDIMIEEEPTQKSYLQGTNFESTGMKVIAVYDNDYSEEVSDYEIINGNNLVAGQENVVIRYSQGGITKEKEQQITVLSYILYQENGKLFLENILPDTKVRNIILQIGMEDVLTEIYYGDKKIEDEEEIVGTGMKIKQSQNNEELEIIIIVKGDLNGDGQSDMKDILKLARYYADLDKNLEGAYLKAGDVVKNGEIAMADILKLARVFAKLDNF